MSAAFDKEFDVLLKVDSDPSGLTNINTAVDATKTKLEETSVAASTLGEVLGVAFGGIIFTTILAALTAIPALISEAAAAEVRLTEELLKQSQEFDHAIDQIDRMVNAARTLGDEVKIADKIKAELDRSSAELAAFRAKELEETNNWVHKIASAFGVIGVALRQALGGTVTPEKTLGELQKQAADQTRTLNAELDRTKEKVAAVAIAEADLPKGITTFRIQVLEAQQKLSELDDKRRADPANKEILNQYIEQDTKLKDAETTLEQLLRKQDSLANASSGTAEANREQANALRDAELHLAGIKASLSLIDSDPFMTAGDKARLQYQLLEGTIKIIGTEIADLKTKIAGGFFDPQHIDQARLKLIGYQVELNKVQQEAAKLGGGIKSDLMEWANSFGTVAHQISGLITDTIGGAIQSLSSGISGLIFGTQTLAQAALQFGEQFVSSLIRIGLQMLAQFLLGQALGEASAAAASAIATPIALAYAPAATLAATASYGGAAIAGQGAITEALLAVQGLASVGGFERGGYTGPAGGIVHGNEYVIDSTSLGRAGGPAFFDTLRVALNQRGGARGATAPGGGGPAGGGHHFYLFTDRESLHRHWQSNPSSKKTVIDWVNSAGGHLRT